MAIAQVIAAAVAVAAGAAAIIVTQQRQRAAAAAGADTSQAYYSGADASSWFESDTGLYTLPEEYVEPGGSLLASEPPGASLLSSVGDALIDAAEGAAFILTGGMFDTAARWIKAVREPKNAPYVEAAAAAESRYGIPANLVLRQMYEESKFNPSASNPSGAKGIMQIIPKWHPGVDVWAPLAAIDYGARYLRAQFDKFGTWELALKAYNVGPDALSKILRGERSEPPETISYSRRILADIGLAQL